MSFGFKIDGNNHGRFRLQKFAMLLLDFNLFERKLSPRSMTYELLALLFLPTTLEPYISKAEITLTVPR